MQREISSNDKYYSSRVEYFILSPYDKNRQAPPQCGLLLPCTQNPLRKRNSPSPAVFFCSPLQHRYPTLGNEYSIVGNGHSIVGNGHSSVGNGHSSVGNGHSSVGNDHSTV